MTPQETLVQKLQRRLKGVEAQQAQIAQETGLAQATISRIASGKCSPRLDTAEALLSWLDAQEKRAKRAKRRKAVAA